MRIKMHRVSLACGTIRPDARAGAAYFIRTIPGETSLAGQRLSWSSQCCRRTALGRKTRWLPGANLQVAPLDVPFEPPPHVRSIALSRSALPTTLTDDNAMAAAAMIGDSSKPKLGYSTPAAIGMPAAL